MNIPSNPNKITVIFEVKDQNGNKVEQNKDQEKTEENKDSNSDDQKETQKENN